MRKLFLAAAAAAIAVAGFTVFAFAGTGQQSTSWEFTTSKKGEKKASGSNSIIVPAKKDDKGTPSDSSDELPNALARIAALERMIGQQAVDLDFFQQALQRVGGERQQSGVPGGTASTRSSKR